MGKVAETMIRKLEARFAPTRLELVDDSQRHAGHAGTRPEGETHFSLVVVAEAFGGLNRLARQRLIHACLAEELAGPVHALSIAALAPGEEQARS
jgi:BolA protein